jgi:hypothetical protein
MSIDKLFSSRSNLVIFSPFSNSMIEKYGEINFWIEIEKGL